MSREPFHTRAYLCMSIILIFFAFTAQRSVAQMDCDCFGPDVQQQIQICVDGQMRTVDVTLCTDSYCPSQYYPHSCAIQPVNGRTVIKEICPVGWSAPNIDKYLVAIIMQTGLCCSGGINLPPCAVNTDYLWLVSSSKCWQLDAATNCWTACPVGHCCSFLIRYQPGVPGPGDCLTTIVQGCTDPAVCPTGACETQICTLPGGPGCCH